LKRIKAGRMVELRKHGATAARFTSSNLPTEYQIVEALRQNEGATVIERDVKTMREVPCQGYTEWLDFEAARQASSNPEPVAKPALAPTQSPASPPSVVTDDADSEGPWPPFEEKKSEPKAKPNPKRAPKVEAAPAQAKATTLTTAKPRPKPRSQQRSGRAFGYLKSRPTF
jgi:hypothetical protein